jgi:uncharacterized protein (UPF0276 family)
MGTPFDLFVDHDGSSCAYILVTGIEYVKRHGCHRLQDDSVRSHDSVCCHGLSMSAIAPLKSDTVMYRLRGQGGDSATA